MSDKKRKAQETGKRKKKYRSDGTPVWGKRYIDGPGVWVSCVKGKEKQTVGELYDLFDSLASELWPTSELSYEDNSDSEEVDKTLSIEAQIAKEVSAIKRPRKERRFVNCQINTPCVVFISCKLPVDPVTLVMRHVENVVKTGITRTRYTQRLVPVSGTCIANLPEIQALCCTVFEPFFAPHEGKAFKYKIELRMRNHNTIPRPAIIQHVAQCVPEGHIVELTDPDVFILVEVFKSVCGVSIVEDYYRLQKFNVMEISNAKKSGEDQQPGSLARVPDSGTTSEAII